MKKRKRQQIIFVLLIVERDITFLSASFQRSFFVVFSLQLVIFYIYTFILLFPLFSLFFCSFDLWRKNRNISRIWRRHFLFPTLLSTDTAAAAASVGLLLLFHVHCKIKKKKKKKISFAPWFSIAFFSLQYDTQQPGKVHLKAVTREAEGRYTVNATQFSSNENYCSIK